MQTGGISRIRSVGAVDLRALALLRIAVGLLVLADLLVIRLPDHLAFFCRGGIFPLELRDKWPHNPFPSIYLVSEEPLWVVLIFALTCLSAVALILGYRTRVAAALTWYLVTSTQIRNIYLCDGSDQLIKVILFWLALMPSGARASVDARRAPQWEALPNSFFSLASAGYVQQMALIYFMAALLKTDAMWREKGDALLYILSRGELATPLGRFASGFPSMLGSLTFAVQGLEFLLPILILSPWARERCRTTAVISLTFFHLGILLLMRIGLFPLISIGTSLALLPGPAMDFLEARCSRPAALWSSMLNKIDGWLPATPESSLPGNFRLARPWKVMAVVTMAYVLWINNETRFAERPPQPPILKWFGALTQQNQRWALFAPRPIIMDGWTIIEGTCRNGDKIDLFRNGAPVSSSYSDPSLISARIPNQRWRRYIEFVLYGEVPPLAPALLAWEANRWNLQHQGPQQVVSVRLIYLIGEKLSADQTEKFDTQIREYRVGQEVDYNPPAKEIVTP